jgi:hypothetical protein
MISRLHLTTIVFIVGVAWLGLLVLDGVAVQMQWLRHCSTVVPILLILLAAFDKWLWKLPIVNGSFTHRPVLHGTWMVMLQTEWKDPKTKQIPGPITCFMTVRQTYASLSMRLMTPESSSALIANSVVRSDDGVVRVVGVYMNTPGIALRGKRSEIHYGALLLEVHDLRPTSLEGHYWTDRHTRGSLRFVRRVTTLLTTYDSARLAFSDDSRPSTQEKESA